MTTGLLLASRKSSLPALPSLRSKISALALGSLATDQLTACGTAASSKRAPASNAALMM
jgi:hypothetical protein